MAVIGTDDEIIFARIGDDVWKVVVGLSRDVDIVITQAVFRNRTGAAEGAADRLETLRKPDLFSKRGPVP